MREAKGSPVLFVLPQTDASANGGIVSVSEVIQRLRHHRPIIVTDKNTARTDMWRQSGIETHVVPLGDAGLFRDPIGTVAGYWRNFRAIRRLIASSGAKVVHANSPLALELALAAAKLAGSKIILNLRDTLDPARRVFRPRFYFRFAAADHMLFLSHDMASRWAEVAPNATRAFSVTYSIVDPDVFVPTPPYSGKGPPVVLLSGILRAKKGQLDFIRYVAPTLASKGIETWIAGDFDPSRNEYMRGCAEAAAPLGEMVKFLGYRSDIAALMRRSAVIAVASRHEGLVRAMIEAMSCARPVVSFDISSARELLEEQSRGAGRAIAVGDYAAMAEALIHYCHDRKAAERAGKAGHSTAERLFAPDVVASRYEQVYDLLEASGDA